MLPLLLLLPPPAFPLHFVLFALLSCHSLATLAHVNYATTTTTTSLGMYGTRMYPSLPRPLARPDCADVGRVQAKKTLTLWRS